jgi:hypothetical protein
VKPAVIAGIFTVIVASGGWIISVENRLASNAERITRSERDSEVGRISLQSIDSRLSDVAQRLSRIEGQLERGRRYGDRDK